MIFIPSHTILGIMIYPPVSVHPYFWITPSFHQIVLKPGGQLDHEVVQHILFRNTTNFDEIYYIFLGIFSDDFVSRGICPKREALMPYWNSEVSHKLVKLHCLIKAFSIT